MCTCALLYEDLFNIRIGHYEITCDRSGQLHVCCIEPWRLHNFMVNWDWQVDRFVGAKFNQLTSSMGWKKKSCFHYSACLIKVTKHVICCLLLDNLDSHFRRDLLRIWLHNHLLLITKVLSIISHVPSIEYCKNAIIRYKSWCWTELCISRPNITVLGAKHRIMWNCSITTCFIFSNISKVGQVP